MIEISGYVTSTNSEDKSQSRVKCGTSDMTIDLMLHFMCEGVRIEYILCGVLIFDPEKTGSADLGHYSTMNMDFNTGLWTGMDDDTIRPISSFPLMNEIRKFVDKGKLTSIVYTRANVCAVV